MNDHSFLFTILIGDSPQFLLFFLAVLIGDSPQFLLFFLAEVEFLVDECVHSRADVDPIRAGCRTG